MQVQRINNNNIIFGYNAALNKELIKTLKEVPVTSENGAFAKGLLMLNGFTNKAENYLRTVEKSGDKNAIEQCADFFLTLKSYLASSVNTLFPELNYGEKEAISYGEEFLVRNIKEENHWLKQAMYEVTEDKKENKEMQIPIMVIQQIMREANDVSKEDVEESAEAIADNSKKILEEASESVQKGANIVKEYVSQRPTGKSASGIKWGFNAMGGMKELKDTLNKRIVETLKDPVQAKFNEVEYGIKMPKGILLYGPPGCGKTTVIERLSEEAGVPLFKLEAGSVGSAYIHETSEKIDAAFDYAEYRAKEGKPAIVFIDDADAFFGTRSNSASDGHHTEELSSFLNRIQQAGDKNLVVAAATNRFDMLDEAIRSRFEEQVYVGLPDLEARKAIVKLFMQQRTKGLSLAKSDEALTEIAKALEGYPVRAIKMFSDKAANEAMNDGRRDIFVSDFKKIISENPDMKVKENNYQSKSKRVSIGFNNSVESENSQVKTRSRV